MAQPPLRLPPCGPRAPLAPRLLQPFLLPETFHPQAPPAPWLLQPFVLPETFYPQGSPILCRLPGQEQPFPAGWAPPLGVAPLAPQAPPAGLQRAPCGCCFNPRVFHIEWTTTTLPPPATATLGQGAASLPSAAWWGFGTPLAWAAPGTPQGPTQHLLPYNHQGRAVAPAPTVLPTSIPSHQDIKGQSAWTNISSTATPMGSSPGSNIPLGSDVPHSQAPGDPVGDLEVSEELLLEEALRLFGCSPDALEVSQVSPSSSLMPGDSSGTGGEGRAVAPAPLMMSTSIPGHQDIEGQSSWINISSTATPMGASPGSNIPPGSDVPPSPCAVPPNQAPGDPAGDLAVSEELPFEEAVSLFCCSLDTVGVSKDGPGSSPMPRDPVGTGREQTAVAPAPPVLPTSIPGYQDIEGQPSRANICGTATPAGGPPGTNITPGSDVPPSPCAIPHNQAPGDPAGNLAVSEEVPLEEALRLFDCSLNMVGVSQDGPGSGPMPGDSGGTGAAIPHRDFASLPEELLTPDYSVPETLLMLQEFNSIWMEP